MITQTLSRGFAGLVPRPQTLVAVTTLIVCASFAAHAVASLVEARYLDSSAHASPPRRVQDVVPATASTPDGAELVVRNMFCSTCAAALAMPGPTNASLFYPAAVLIATSVGSQASATLRVPATEVQGSFGVGDTIAGIGTLTRIGFVSVDVRDEAGRIGTLLLLGGRSEASAATLAPAAAAPDVVDDPFDGRIKKLDDTTFEVERALVRDLVSGSVKAAGLRISPITKDGKLEGLRVGGVRAGSVASGLGLLNGDVLQAINNTKIESANTLLDVYAGLDRLSSVELSGTRRGKPLNLMLRLR